MTTKKKYPRDPAVGFRSRQYAPQNHAQIKQQLHLSQKERIALSKLNMGVKEFILTKNLPVQIEYECVICKTHFMGRRIAKRILCKDKHCKGVYRNNCKKDLTKGS